MAAYNLPLRALFDKDQGGSAIGGYRLAVLGGTPKHVVSIHYPHNIVVNAAGWLKIAKARSDCRTPPAVGVRFAGP